MNDPKLLEMFKTPGVYTVRGKKPLSTSSNRLDQFRWFCKRLEVRRLLYPKPFAKVAKYKGTIFFHLKDFHVYGI